MTKDELIAAANQLGLDDPVAAFEEMDENGGGYVLFDEFCAWKAKQPYQAPKPLAKDSSSTLKKSTSSSKSVTSSKAPKVTATVKSAPPAEDLKDLAVPSQDAMMTMFDRSDGNGNEMLSLAELDLLVVREFPTFNNKPALMRAYKAADKDETGYVMKDEFPFFVRYLVYYNNLWNVFAAADDSDDRRLTKDELIAAADPLGLDDPAAAFDEMDQNGGGYVLFDEFCAWKAKHP